MFRKVIFLDCDGTIFDVPRGMLNVSKKTLYAINQLIKSGHLVFIASGRPKCLIPSYLKDIKNLNFLTCNGQLTYLADGTIIGKHKFDKSLISRINQYCIEHDCLYFDETIDYIYTQNTNNQLFKEFANLWNIDKNVFLDGYNLDACYMMMAAFKNKEMANEFYKEFQNIVHAVPQYGFESCDINLNGVSKATGVKDVLNYFGINKMDAYAFGDGLNDIEMLQEVGNGYCMANGNAKLKECIKLKAPDVLDDGFYQIMIEEKLIVPPTKL